MYVTNVPVHFQEFAQLKNSSLGQLELLFALEDNVLRGQLFLLPLVQ